MSEDKKIEDEILEENQLEEEIKEEEKNLNESINKSRTNMMCNHCLYVSKTYEEMKKHYKSEFHKYNLNRVTMNLAPLSFEEYKRKKEFFIKKMEEKKKNEEKIKLQSANLYCDICNKKFNSRKKLDEHLTSKTHLKNKSDFRRYVYIWKYNEKRNSRRKEKERRRRKKEKRRRKKRRRR